MPAEALAHLPPILASVPGVSVTSQVGKPQSTTNLSVVSATHTAPTVLPIVVSSSVATPPVAASSVTTAVVYSLAKSRLGCIR